MKYRNIQFSNIPQCDLYPQTVLRGGDASNLSSEPISQCFPVGNQGGIRFTGPVARPKIVVLFSTQDDQIWPDQILDDKVIYFGDNKTPGDDLHENSGNKLLNNIFSYFHLSKREQIPPIFLFTNYGGGFDRKYEGLVVPGYKNMTEYEDLIAFWKTKDNSRFLNYRAVFTLLNIDLVKREWINDIENGKALSDNSPIKWEKWIKK